MPKASVIAMLFTSLLLVVGSREAPAGGMSLRPLTDLRLDIAARYISMSPSGKEALVAERLADFFYVLSLNAEGTSMQPVKMPYPRADLGIAERVVESRVEWGEQGSLRFWTSKGEVLTLSEANRLRPAFSERSTTDSAKRDALERYCTMESNTPPATHFEDEDGNWVKPIDLIMRRQANSERGYPEDVMGVERLVLVEAGRRTEIVNNGDRGATGFLFDPLKRRIYVRHGPGHDFIYAIDTEERIVLPGYDPGGKSHMEYWLIPGKDYLVARGTPLKEHAMDQFEFSLFLCDLRGSILESIPLDAAGKVPGRHPNNIACSDKLVIFEVGLGNRRVVRVLGVEETP